jgi:dihydropteroate synthase
MSEHILFLTGKLAAPRLQRVLEDMPDKDFTWEVRDVGLSVAALMTASLLRRRLSGLEGVDRIMVPGLCRGDLEALSQHLGLPLERGPVDLKDIPVYFGQGGREPDLSLYSVRIFAEIVEAPYLGIEAILARARRYADDGADVIDLGCLPDTPFPRLEEAVRALKQEGFCVSIDSLEEDDLLRGGRAGADYLLSLKESTLWIADQVEATPVLIPEQHTDMESLYRVIERCLADGRPFLADSILDPIHFGFTDSVLRYSQLRRDYPDIDIIMGIGNLTELTEADTTGVNAILFGIISELDVNHVLTTEVSSHARSAVREADRARRIMHYAKGEHSLPKGIDAALLTTHARKPFPYGLEEIRELAADIRDPNYRIQVSEEGVHVFNRDGMATAGDPFSLFPQLAELQDDAPHAFYMGVELARAQIAWQLGKRYVQDEELDWGAAVAPDRISESEAQTRAAHAHREGDFKPAGSTMKASRRKRSKKNKNR